MDPFRSKFPPAEIAKDLFELGKTIHHYEVPTKISRKDISVIVPVKNNQNGIDLLLQSFNTLPSNCQPSEVVIVDNNSCEPIRISHDKYSFSVKLLTCKTAGPAAARNLGASNAVGEWLLFTDSDCVPTPSLINGYCKEDNRCVAFAGSVQINGDDEFSSFYRRSNTLIPKYSSEHGVAIPWTLVTANCLINKKVFEQAGGFNEAFPYAGGEDTELGIRIRRFGRIEYNFRSVAIHSFEDGLPGLISRFIRYGRGQYILSSLYDHPGLTIEEPLKTSLSFTPQDHLDHVAENSFCWGFISEKLNIR